MKRVQLGGALVALLAVMSPNTGLAQDAAPVFADFNPNNFTNPTTVDNKYFPLKPGTKLASEGKAKDTEGDEETLRIEFTVTGLTKKIANINAVVVSIDDYADGELVETELAFFAQDNDGNVWFLGEYPEEYEDGDFLGAKPWIHGLQEAKAGLYMKSAPKVGDPTFYQGWGPAVQWDDFWRVVETGKEDCVPVACYKDVVVLEEANLSEKGAFQIKSYAPGVGDIRTGWKGEDASQEELQLVEFATLDADALSKVNAKALELEKHAYEVSEVYKQTTPSQ
jgi:hypothetical protein